MSSKTTVLVKFGSKSPSKSLLKSLDLNWFAICQPENKVMRWIKSWHAKVVITGQSNTELMGCCLANCFAGALLDTKKKHIEVNLSQFRQTGSSWVISSISCRLASRLWCSESVKANILYPKRSKTFLCSRRNKDSIAVWPSPSFTPSKVKADMANADITLLRPMILYIIMTWAAVWPMFFIVFPRNISLYLC